MDEAKRHLRELSRAARRALPADTRESAAEAVAARVLALLEAGAPAGVLAYAATAEELDPAATVAALRAGGARIAYPRVCAPGELTLHWADADELARGYCGIAEPAADAEEAPLADIGLVLVPGAAFDEACARLGMGGGFYDRLLPRLAPGTLTVGLSFDEQLCECVPTGPHDVTLDAVVTPTRTLRR